MKKVIKMCIVMFTLAVFGASCVTAYANSAVDAMIPIKCIANGVDENYTYTIKAKDPGAPMPANASITLKDGQTDYFVISCSEPNTWHYEISLSGSQKKKNNIIYDKSTYNVALFIGSRDNGELYTENIIYKEGSTEKVNECSYKNKFRVSPEDDEHSSKKTGKDSDKNSSEGNTVGTNVGTGAGTNGGSSSSVRGSSYGSSTGDGSGTGNGTPPAKLPGTQTGDTRNPGLYLIMAILAAMTIFAVADRMFRSKEED